jgi:hypothetical protein
MTADRERIVNNLASIMRKKLNLPRCVEKGDNWNDFEIAELMELFLREFHELCDVLGGSDINKIQGEIADCANYLAMLNDKILFMEITGEIIREKH